MSAILFESISTLADTSELQRESFNKAFANHHLGWTWSRPEYLAMLDTSGGADRVATYAQSRGEQVDADAVHATKSEIFQRDVATAHLQPRSHVAQTIAEARIAGMKVALVTTTSAANVTALLGALSPQVTPDMFDVIVDVTDVEQRKPAGEAYQYALDKLGENASDCVAIEDNVDGVNAAQAAGVTCVAFPNQNTAGHDFTHADQRVDDVRLQDLTALLPNS